MVKFENWNGVEKDVFILSQTWEKEKKYYLLRGIELQTFGFRALMFFRWATENSLARARPSQGSRLHV